ncbi:hypothetical protein, conserved [Eimeria praecox]|uniref:Uncharacterized protein n=1 Tax=Eimeria praecox TaxID=51316 RepID=U6GXC0_9EIME|nr:hypothetical protein, conserved [Eimeria praecox]
MRVVIIAVVIFSVLFNLSAVAEDAFLPPARKASMEIAKPSTEDAGLLEKEGPNGAPESLQASLELRRLRAEDAPRTIPRPKGLPALLASIGLLGHAGVQAAKDWNTMAIPRPSVALLLGKARFDTVNMALYSLLAGIALFYLGTSRRWRSHRERNLWRIDELLRQDRERVEAIRRGARKT